MNLLDLSQTIGDRVRVIHSTQLASFSVLARAISKYGGHKWHIANKMRTQRANNVVAGQKKGNNTFLKAFS